MTPENARGLGRVVTDFDATEVAIVPWPRQGWRPVTRGDEGGVTEGAFTSSWQGDFLVGCSDNFAVDDFETHYVRDGVIIIPKNGIVPAGTVI